MNIRSLIINEFKKKYFKNIYGIMKEEKDNKKEKRKNNGRNKW